MGESGDPAKATQRVLVNGVEVERIIPRLRERSERQAKALMAKKRSSKSAHGGGQVSNYAQLNTSESVERKKRYSTKDDGLV